MGNCICCTCARGLVSKKKRRMQLEYSEEMKDQIPEGGVDLDYSVIHPNVIVMGFPATGVESCYRNPCDEVKEYLDLNYGDHYKVYNLCAEPEHQYPASRFDGRVAIYPFLDMTPCQLSMIPLFVKDAVSFIQRPNSSGESPSSSECKLLSGVAVIHCKAGKGRSGMMACCLLMELSPRQFPDASTALAHYDTARTSDGRGVNHRSQRRYVHYYETLREKSNGELPSIIPVIRLRQIVLHSFILRVDKLHQIDVQCGSNSAVFTLEDDCVAVDCATGTMQVFVEKAASSSEPHGSSRAFLSYMEGDVRIELQKSSGRWLGALCFHTLFVQSQYSYLEVDKVYKKKNMPQDARIELVYDEVAQSKPTA